MRDLFPDLLRMHIVKEMIWLYINMTHYPILHLHTHKKNRNRAFIVQPVFNCYFVLRFRYHAYLSRRGVRHGDSKQLLNN
jgi:hypothetical protein